MKSRVALFLALVLSLSACGKPAPSPAEGAAVPTQVVPESSARQDILGQWILNPAESTGGGSSMLDPLEGEAFEADGVEITPQYLLFGDFGHVYTWIDDRRIRIDGVGIGFAAFNDGFFYVLTVQRDGDVLRFLTADGSPFLVFSAPGALSGAP